MWREAVVSRRFCALFHRRLGQQARKWRGLAMKRAPETPKNDAQTATGLHAKPISRAAGGHGAAFPGIFRMFGA